MPNPDDNLFTHPGTDQFLASLRMSVIDEAKHCIASGVYGTMGVGINRVLQGLLDEIDASHTAAVVVVRDSCTKVALAKDRIFIEYLTSRGLVGDYEEWVGELNKDEVRMQKLVLGE